MGHSYLCLCVISLQWVLSHKREDKSLEILFQGDVGKRITGCLFWKAVNRHTGLTMIYLILLWLKTFCSYFIKVRFSSNEIVRKVSFYISNKRVFCLYACISIRTACELDNANLYLKINLHFIFPVNKRWFSFSGLLNYINNQSGSKIFYALE